MDRKRILFINEGAFLNTGFSKLSKHILNKLYKTDKYDLAELGSYTKTSDPRSVLVPWKYYGGIPEDNQDFLKELYQKTPGGQFGEAVFESICLDFHPDIVIDIRDEWMVRYELTSPFRQKYKLIWLLTIDGKPQRYEWLDEYSRIDTALTYSKFGQDVLKEEYPNKINLFNKPVHPGADTNLYKPLDKENLRTQFNLPKNANIILTVMRNQKRKLYPDLIEIFAQLLKKLQNNGKTELANNTYLYLHTSYPDVGFDIGKHLRDNGIGHRTFVTYICKKCRRFYPSLFQTELTLCKHCGELAAVMPNTQYGLEEEDLVKVYNFADVYCQLSICEGYGLPIAEGKSCGLPAFGIDYTATGDQVNAPGCQSIKVGKFFHEPVTDTEQIRALPDNDDAVEKLYNFLNLPKETKEEWGCLARQDVVDNHSFDRAAKVFEEVIDATEIYDPKTTWFNPKPNFTPQVGQIPEFNSNLDFVDWCIDHITGSPQLKTTYWKSELIRALNSGAQLGRGGRQNFGKSEAIEMFKSLASKQNFWERQRMDMLTPPDEDRVKWRLI